MKRQRVKSEVGDDKSELRTRIKSDVDEKDLDENPEYDNLQFDEEFRFPDGNLVIKTVDNILFKVHRHFFVKHSQAWAKFFKRQHPERSTTPRTASCLDISSKDLRRFLKVFYPPTFGVELFDDPNDWAVLLITARDPDMDFPGIIDMAEQKLVAAGLSDIDKIKFGKRCRLKAMALDGYGGLCTQDQALSTGVVKKLDADEIVTIMKVREGIRSGEFVVENGMAKIIGTRFERFIAHP